MTSRQVLLMGVILGFCASAAVLVLLWFGVAGVLIVGRTDMMYILWPTSSMLTVGWCSTVTGVMTTLALVAINCLLYMVIVYALHRVVRIARGKVRS